MLHSHFLADIGTTHTEKGKALVEQGCLGARHGTAPACDVQSLYFDDSISRIPCAVESQLKPGTGEESECLINSIEI